MNFPLRPLMRDDERELFIKELKSSSSYFEYGTGGSAVWAIAHGLKVNGVDSDLRWINGLKAELGGRYLVEHIDLGPTGDWGYPLSRTQSENFPLYSKAILKHDVKFDLILIDGRFRVACACSAIEHILRFSNQASKSKIFIHDFWNRDEYRVLLGLLDNVDSAHTSGVFTPKDGVDSSLVFELWTQYSENPA